LRYNLVTNQGVKIMKVMLYCGFTCKDIGAYKEVHSP